MKQEFCFLDILKTQSQMSTTAYKNLRRDIIVPVLLLRCFYPLLHVAFKHLLQLKVSKPNEFWNTWCQNSEYVVELKWNPLIVSACVTLRRTQVRTCWHKTVNVISSLALSLLHLLKDYAREINLGPNGLEVKFKHVPGKPVSVLGI